MSSTTKMIQTIKEVDILVIPMKIKIHNAFATGERNVADIAKKYGCSVGTVYHYRKQYLEDRELEDTYCMSHLKISEELGIDRRMVKKLEESGMNKMREYIDANDGLEDVLREIFRLAQLKDSTGTNWNVE